eukprot:TRINITY_DN7635_c0_g1_i1.p2 TRINITY_DN7635_c0_g1~~TRINITY_DN7635_c0_g1_i1.p2  ORF type:complete len:217 (+),score=54.48 TRINITY_DN7635_c0_g1_i1:1002-1652(+)
MGIELDDLLFSGAEARVYRGQFHGKPCIIKERFSKTYRIEKVDQQLRGRRIVAEAKALMRCRKAGIHAPCVYHCDLKTMTLYMQLVQGSRPLREVIDSLSDARQLASIASHVGRIVASLHNIDIVHGDLTTSNLLVDEGGDVWVIDFGLSTQSSLPEDFAVDLYVLERAIESTHTDKDGFCAQILASYESHATKGAKTLERLEKVKARGRKRSMVG